MLTNANMPADAVYALAGVYLNPGAPMSSTQKRDHDPDTPHAVKTPVEPGKADQLAPHLPDAENRQEALVDEGIEETFPASDPVSAKRIT